MTFDEWYLVNEEEIYDVTGGDWDDLIAILRKVHKVGEEEGYSLARQEQSEWDAGEGI